MAIKHKKQNTYPNSTETTLVRPLDWNDEHNHPPFQYVFLASALIWTNMPAALTELGATVYRQKIDLTFAAQVRLIASLAVLGAASAQLRAQYSTDQSTWNYLDGGTGPAITVGGGTTGVRDSGWVNLVAGAKADVFVRVAGITGDGAADPQFRNICLQVR